MNLDDLDNDLKRRVYEFIRPRRLWIEGPHHIEGPCGNYENGGFFSGTRILAKHGNVVLRFDGVVTINGEFKKRLWKKSDYGHDAVFTFRGDPQINDDYVSYSHPYDTVHVLESLHDDFKLEDRTAPFTRLTSTRYVIASGNQIRVTDLRTRTTKYIESPEWPDVQLTDFICIHADGVLYALDFDLHLMYWCVTEDLYSIFTFHGEILGSHRNGDQGYRMTQEVSLTWMMMPEPPSESFMNAWLATGRFDEDGNVRPADEFDREFEDHGPDMIL